MPRALVPGDREASRNEKFVLQGRTLMINEVQNHF